MADPSVQALRVERIATFHLCDITIKPQVTVSSLAFVLKSVRSPTPGGAEVHLASRTYRRSPPLTPNEPWRLPKHGADTTARSAG
jgi:hypothetical protein